MVDLLINQETGDLDFYNKTIRLTENNQQLTRQRIDATLNTYRGEWIYDILEGIPYLENSNNPIQLIGRGSKEDFDSYFKQAILNKPFVERISYYRSELNNITKNLTVDIRIQGTEGEEITFSTEI